MGKTGDCFARWYYARRGGQQFLLCLSLLLAVAVGLTVTVWDRPEQPPEGTVKILCGDERYVYPRQDDPRLTAGLYGSVALNALCDDQEL